MFRGAQNPTSRFLAYASVKSIILKQMMVRGSYAEMLLEVFCKIIDL